MPLRRNILRRLIFATNEASSATKRRSIRVRPSADGLEERVALASLTVVVQHPSVSVTVTDAHTNTHTDANTNTHTDANTHTDRRMPAPRADCGEQLDNDR